MSLGAPTPDLQGFSDAQEYLRQQFGRDIRFYGPAAMIYDPSTPAASFDDEGIPLDPLVGASAVNDAGLSIDDLSLVGCSFGAMVVFKPLQTSILRRDQTIEDPVAIRSGLNRDLILRPEDLSQTEGAEYFLVGTYARDADGNVIYPTQFTADDGELWKIVNVKLDSFGSVQRVIVYGQGTL